MKLRIKFLLKGLGAILALFCCFLLVASLLPKEVSLRVYGANDEATGGWLLVEMRRSGNGAKWTPAWRTGDGRGEGEQANRGQPLKLTVEQLFDDHLEATLAEGEKAARKLNLKLLAEGDTERTQTGYGCWGLAAFLKSESTVLTWQPAMPHAKAWKTLEKAERKRQEELLEQDVFFTWADWLRSFKPDEQKMGYEKLLSQDLVAMGDGWITVTRSCYDFSGGAHGNSSFSHETYVLEGDGARLFKTEDLFAGKLPTEVLLPSLRKAYQKWGEGYVDAKDLDQTLMSASIRPAASGLLFCYDPYAIGPYAAGSPELTVPLSAFADVVDWIGPARLFWPREAARRASR